VTREMGHPLLEACAQRPVLDEHSRLSPGEVALIREGLSQVPGSTGELARALLEEWNALVAAERVAALLVLAELLADRLGAPGNSGPT
jgi:hypothetical protein